MSTERMRISPPDEFPGPEVAVPLIVEVMYSEPLGESTGTLVPPSRDGDRCAIWTGVGLAGHELVIDLDWTILSGWVFAVIAARNSDASPSEGDAHSPPSPS